ncbi:mycothiol system anti-sigma-R factor [Serinibacter salmoneus]|uniref:Mycothiol system anti-sigma-R factor n=1 Tax=Serinibacter salmoneus TaxID=556530 RepID=A0A2A9D232_9MICO|nr:mycothiol system anti-sigma-R factor [Serinibacter salmoneus]PFG20315.1 mycothiol system anti-sigma-R factor [Serinibacter salmoneus]
MSACESASGGVNDDCRAALAQLEDLLDHALSEPDADLVRAHLESCEPCMEAADVEEHVRLLIRKACIERAPSTLRARIVTQVAMIRRG